MLTDVKKSAVLQNLIELIENTSDGVHCRCFLVNFAKFFRDFTEHLRETVFESFIYHIISNSFRSSIKATDIPLTDYIRPISKILNSENIELDPFEKNVTRKKQDIDEKTVSRGLLMGSLLSALIQIYQIIFSINIF